MKMRNHRQVTNAFGDGSPHWNLPFPKGNLTAAEIIAYCPHWLKSVDVIDRFITNGGRSFTIAAMINEFRVQPGGDTTFVPNSVCMMMQYAMRRAGFKNWTVGTHPEWSHAGEGEWDDTSLKVSDFRTPRITHPKGHVNGSLNQETPPIEFSHLARHVKKHPSGADALDLTRCVLYAVDHPKETWLFPDDFERLVKKLGGRQQVTFSHLDGKVFARRSLQSLSPPPSANLIATPFPRATAKSNGKLMMRTRSIVDSGNGITTPQKRGYVNEDDNDVSSPTVGSKRRSGRLASKATVNLREDYSDLETTPAKKTEYSFTITKKRKMSEDFSADSEFVQSDNDSSGTDNTPNDGDVSDDLLTPPIACVGRHAAKKARIAMQKNATPQKLKSYLPSPIKAPRIPIDPALMEVAREFSTRQPVLLKPPVLSSTRLVVDARSIHLYAEPGATDLWASALSSSRFGGPRRHPPFRELYRLTDPDLFDGSDWAENIRWAKEQFKLFGSTTWTEYDYHLEMITEHRREIMWVSEEAIRFAGRCK